MIMDRKTLKGESRCRFRHVVVLLFFVFPLLIGAPSAHADEGQGEVVWDIAHVWLALDGPVIVQPPYAIQFPELPGLDPINIDRPPSLPESPDLGLEIDRSQLDEVTEFVLDKLDGSEPIAAEVPSAGPVVGVSMTWWLSVATSGGRHTGSAGSEVRPVWIGDYSCSEIRATVSASLDGGGTYFQMQTLVVPHSAPLSDKDGPRKDFGCGRWDASDSTTTAPITEGSSWRTSHNGTVHSAEWKENGQWHPTSGGAIHGVCSAVVEGLTGGISGSCRLNLNQQGG